MAKSCSSVLLRQTMSALAGMDGYLSLTDHIASPDIYPCVLFCICVCCCNSQHHALYWTLHIERYHRFYLLNVYLINVCCAQDASEIIYIELARMNI